MADRGTYVDIFFRNGLKEFEVLPPPEVWDNIQPRLRKRQKSLNLLRFAAVAAILVSLSVFSFWLTTDISKSFILPQISMNQDVVPAGSYLYKNQPATTQLKQVLVINHEINEPVILKEIQSSEQINLKMPSYSLFSGFLNKNTLQKNIIPVIAKADLTGNSGATVNKYPDPDLIPDNSLSSNTSNVVNRWTISALGSPTYFSSSSLVKNDASANLAKNEKPAVSYTGGMAFSYNVNKRISISSGIYYSSVGQ